MWLKPLCGWSGENKCRFSNLLLIFAGIMTDKPSHMINCFPHELTSISLCRFEKVWVMHKGVLCGPVNVFTEINLGYIFILLIFMLNFCYSLVHYSSSVASIPAVLQLKSKFSFFFLNFALQFSLNTVFFKRDCVSWQIMRCYQKQHKMFLRTTVHGEEALFI